MENAFQQAFAEGFSRVLIIGSDIPDLPSTFLEEAFESLETHDAVIGPANDGGYYLIGCTRNTFSPAIFSGMIWSSRTVYRKTMETLERNGHRVHVLRQWDDVDTIADLEKLIARNRHAPPGGSRTLSFLKTTMSEEFRPTGS
jgi:rSAM/selenodomain-associated transferase 1